MHGHGKLNMSVHCNTSTSYVILHYSIDHPIYHRRLCLTRLFDRERRFCSDRAILTLERSNFLIYSETAGIPSLLLGFEIDTKSLETTDRGITKPLMSRQRTRWPGQQATMSIPYLQERHLRDTRPTPQTQSAHMPTTTLSATVVKAKDTVFKDGKAGAIYQFPCKGCTSRYVWEYGKTLKSRITQYRR